MRLRNSCGSESSASSTTSTKCSRFILHPRAHSLRVAVAFVILIFFPAVVFIFLFVLLVWFLSKEGFTLSINGNASCYVERRILYHNAFQTLVAQEMVCRAGKHVNAERNSRLWVVVDLQVSWLSVKWRSDV